MLAMSQSLQSAKNQGSQHYNCKKLHSAKNSNEHKTHNCTKSLQKGIQELTP